MASGSWRVRLSETAEQDFQTRDEIRPGLRTLHVTRGRRRGRHFVVYRVAQPNVIDVVRSLHDAMDLARHLPLEAP